MKENRPEIEINASIAEVWEVLTYLDRSLNRPGDL
jgi:hypothetical protein